MSATAVCHRWEVSAGVDRALEETVARCVGIVVYHHNERTSRASGAMASEVRAAVGWLTATGLGIDAIDRRVVGPVESELIARYGPEAGCRLYQEFVRSFDLAVSPRPRSA